MFCRAKRRGARPPPLNPETAQLGRDVMQHLRNMKIRQCSEGLISMGFTQGAYEMARKCGGDQILAAQHFADGTLQHMCLVLYQRQPAC